MDFVSRFGAKATKARQAQSRLKALEKMESIELKKAPTTSRIQLPAPAPTGKMILETIDLDCGYGDRKILNKVQLRLERGDHLGIVGFNGAGKSTLLKTLATEINGLGGEIKWGHQVQLSYFAQHTPEKLQPNDTVLESLQLAAHKDCTQQDILNMAGSLLFSGDAIYKKTSVLSGGEKSRVALGQMLLKKAPLLLMDEPTNHLDFDTVEALTEALAAYEGTIVTVSHDRSFIGRVATKILEVHNGALTLYPGTYDEYVWSVQKGVLAERDLSSQEARTSSNTNKDLSSESKFNYKEERKRIEAEIRKTSKAIQDLDKKLNEKAKLRDELNEHLLGATGDKAAALAKDLHQASEEIESYENQMLDYMELEQKLQGDLGALIS